MAAGNGTDSDQSQRLLVSSWWPKRKFNIKTTFDMVKLFNLLGALLFEVLHNTFSVIFNKSLFKFVFPFRLAVRNANLNLKCSLWGKYYHWCLHVNVHCFGAVSMVVFSPCSSFLWAQQSQVPTWLGAGKSPKDKTFALSSYWDCLHPSGHKTTQMHIGKLLCWICHVGSHWRQLPKLFFNSDVKCSYCFHFEQVSLTVLSLVRTGSATYDSCLNMSWASASHFLTLWRYAWKGTFEPASLVPPRPPSPSYIASFYALLSLSQLRSPLTFLTAVSETTFIWYCFLMFISKIAVACQLLPAGSLSDVV